jgi:hypothetical protein
MLTQRWQDQARALDVQTALVAEMTEASENMLVAIPDAQREIIDSTINAPSRGFRTSSKRPPASQRAINDLDTSHDSWLIRQAVIGSRLRAYYRDSSIPAEWDRLSDQLQNLYSRAIENADKGVTDEEGITRIGLFRDEVVQHVLDTTPRV